MWELSHPVVLSSHPQVYVEHQLVENDNMAEFGRAQLVNGKHIWELIEQEI